MKDPSKKKPRKILQIVRKGKETYRENEMRNEKNDLHIYEPNQTGPKIII